MRGPVSPKFVVTGCSRSGTKYIAKLLTALGHPTSHERVFSIHRVKRLEEGQDVFEGFDDLDGASSFLAAPFLHLSGPGTLVLHQVRHPEAVVRSHLGIGFFAFPPKPSEYLADNHEDFLTIIRRYAPEVFEQPSELGRCLQYWVSWNGIVADVLKREDRPYFQYQLEGIDLALLRSIDELFCGACTDSELEAALAAVPRSVNARPRDDTFVWRDVAETPLGRRADALAREFGYML